MTVRQVRLSELWVDGKRLGRHVVHDDASRNYPAHTAAAAQSVDHQAQGLPLDQGQVGSCTANALCGALNSAPNSVKLRHGPFREQHGVIRLYGLETQLEGQPYPPNDPGGSGLEVCKAARQLGWITSYQHAFSIQDALLALVLRPVITGVSWMSSFDTPDASGHVAITPDAYVRGGHEVLADQLIVPAGATISDLDQIVVGLWNSWGPGYGQGGRFYWTAATWAQLLSEQGDVTIPIA